MPARIPGFGNIASSAGAAGIGGTAQQKFDLGQQLTEAALRAKGYMEVAKLRADATRYTGQQDANAMTFGAIAGAIGDVVAPIAGRLASRAGAARDQFLRNEADVKSTYQIPNYSKPITWGTGDWN